MAHILIRGGRAHGLHFNAKQVRGHFHACKALVGISGGWRKD
jgi:hypothetical protein